MTAIIIATIAIIVGLAAIANSVAVLRRDKAFCAGFAERHGLDYIPANVGECIKLCR